LDFNNIIIIFDKIKYVIFMKLIKNTLDDLNNYLEIFSSNNKYYPLVENKNMIFKDNKKEIIPRKIN